MLVALGTDDEPEADMPLMCVFVQRGGLSFLMSRAGQKGKTSPTGGEGRPERTRPHPNRTAG